MMKRGFTLLELLVVIAIIGVLSTVVIASLNPAREKARDATRIKNLQEVAKALELYYSDNEQYPIPSGLTGSNCDSSRGNKACTDAAPSAGTWKTTGTGLYDVVTAGYISALPSDPVDTNHLFYAYSACMTDGRSYRLRAYLESEDRYHIISNGPQSEGLFFDVNFDGMVTNNDRMFVSSCDGSEGLCIIADLNQDGSVDLSDYDLYEEPPQPIGICEP